MAAAARFFILGGLILLFILTIIAGYTYSKIRALSLPIPQALALFTILLPFITGISIQAAHGLIQRSSRNKQSQVAIPLIAVIGFQLVYDTAVATLALAYMLPPSSLHCGLESSWASLYRAKKEDAIRTIQDSLNCCGFNSVVDRAYPFGYPSPCPSVFNRSNSCFRGLRQQEQIYAGLIFLVALVMFLVKVVSIISFLTTSSWTGSSFLGLFRHLRYQNSSSQEEDGRAEIRGLIEEASAPGSYRDDPNASDNRPPGSNRIQSQGPRVVPSPLVDDPNEWQDE